LDGTNEKRNKGRNKRSLARQEDAKETQKSQPLVLSLLEKKSYGKKKNCLPAPGLENECRWPIADGEIKTHVSNPNKRTPVKYAIEPFPTHSPASSLPTDIASRFASRVSFRSELTISLLLWLSVFLERRLLRAIYSL